ncbi:hypothetical protein CBW65_11360 [Tumebacillus avium]|uniref:ParB/Sulfiredoxin domain-containing protein n=1 Tax=Tumebacillus avium TaxID=1903704 RepID=A0A1Y0IMR1_9BACL|nr:ParB N-terminal domain-containing protein [Tumebacillus avium]ARU61540.1 hypothetical protein CBW65_11360 [Tumebacillus avium]
MYDAISQLKVVDMDQLCLHETHECVRLDKTCQSILVEGVLRNPPLAAKMKDGRYLILDGAHRTCSLQKLGCLRSVVQLVHDDFFQLESWHHVVPTGDWLDQLLQDPLLRVETATSLTAESVSLLTADFAQTLNTESANLVAIEPVATLVDSTGTEYFFYPASAADDPSSRLNAWHQIVTSYCRDHSVQRIAAGEVSIPSPGHVLLRYPATTVEELDALVTANQVMPAGVTRCIVQGRLLNLRVPLDLLTAPDFQEDVWEGLCDRWKQSLRLYSEAVYLCEV